MEPTFKSEQIESGNNISPGSIDLSPVAGSRIGQQDVKPQAVKPRNVAIIDQIPVGTNNDGSPKQSFFSFTLSALSRTFVPISFTNVKTTNLITSKFLYTIYIDSVDFAQAWPFGFNVDSSKYTIILWDSANKFVRTSGVSQYSPIKPNESAWWLEVVNSDTSAHTFMVFYAIRFNLS